VPVELEVCDVAARSIAHVARRHEDAVPAALDPALEARHPLPVGTRTLPDFTICTPAIARISVVIPQQLGPRRPVMRPGRISKSSP
jgi:hypothetical protein